MSNKSAPALKCNSPVGHSPLQHNLCGDHIDGVLALHGKKSMCCSCTALLDTHSNLDCPKHIELHTVNAGSSSQAVIFMNAMGQHNKLGALLDKRPMYLPSIPK